MLNIKKEKKGESLTVYLSGSLDTTTIHQFQDEMEEGYEGLCDLVFDLKDLTYVSSVGLREFLSAEQEMEDMGSELTLRNVSPGVMEILDVTGMSGILNIE